MSITEEYLKQKKAHEEETDISKSEKKKIEGPTLQQILANKEQSDLFGEYLGMEDSDELAKRVADDTIESGDWAELAEKRKGFLELLERSKTISESMNSEMLGHLVSSSPELQAIADSVGEEGIKKAVTKHLPRIAITERERFADLEGALSKAKKSKEAIDKGNENVRKWCLEHGVSEKAYAKLLVDGDTREVVKQIRSQYGVFKRAFSRRKTTDNEIYGKSLKDTDAINRFLEQYDKEVKGVGDILNATMMETPLVRDTLIAELKQEPGPKMDANISFKEAREAVNNEAFDENEFMTGLAKYRAGHPKESQGDSLHTFSQAFATEKMKKKPGFWAKIFAVLMGSGIENKMKGK